MVIPLVQHIVRRTTLSQNISTFRILILTAKCLYIWVQSGTHSGSTLLGIQRENTATKNDGYSDGHWLRHSGRGQKLVSEPQRLKARSRTAWSQHVHIIPVLLGAHAVSTVRRRLKTPNMSSVWSVSWGPRGNNVELQPEMLAVTTRFSAK